MDNSLEFLSEADYSVTAFEFAEETPVFVPTKRNNNPLIIALAGTMLWSSNCDAVAIKNSINHDVEFCINDYNDISTPLSNYLNEIQEAVLSKRYTKRQLFREICSFKALNNNWDGYGSLPVEIESAANTMELIEVLGDEVFESISNIFPNPNGTISIIWQNEINETISLEIGNRTFSYYVDFTSQETLYFDNIELNASEIYKLAAFVKQMV